MASRSSGKPMCPCGRTFRSRLSPRMLIVWASSEGRKWSWQSDAQAYFRYCEDCHMKHAWPEDLRCKGPHCKPKPSSWRSLRKLGPQGQARLVSGDFWLTRESPLMPEPAALRRAVSAPSRPPAATAEAAAPARRSRTRSPSPLPEPAVVSWADAGAWERQAHRHKRIGRSRPQRLGGECGAGATVAGPFLYRGPATSAVPSTLPP
jgi:hypothetical protein